MDVSRTLAAVVDGTEGDGATRSGLSKEDFWIAEPTFVQLTGGGGGNTWDLIYVGKQKYDFMGQTIHITKDLDMGGQYDGATDSWSGPNWTPIGGKFSMDSYAQDNFSLRDVSTIHSSFNGFLDGDGHTISHMYCDRYIKKGFEFSQGVALVGQMGELYDEEDTGYGHADEAEVAPEDWTPGVSNIAMGTTVSADTTANVGTAKTAGTTVSAASTADPSTRGYIYGRRMVGGIVGLVGDIPSGILVENCANFATLGCCDSKGIGGIVGSGWGRGGGTIRNCYNAGNLTATYPECPAGGISGANSMNIYNCYNTGQIWAGGSGSAAEIRSSGIGRHDSGSYTVDNCYSLQGSFQDTTSDGYATGTATTVVCNAYVRSREEMKAAEFRDELNANAGAIFVEDSAGINSGFPILFWQAPDYDAAKRDTTRTINIAAATPGGKITAQIPRVKTTTSHVESATRQTGGSTAALQATTASHTAAARQTGESTAALQATATAYSDTRALNPGESAVVPYGTVITLTAEAALPNVLEHFLAGNKAMRANYFVVTDDATLGASFIELKQGTIHFADSETAHLGMSKEGTALNSFGKATAVTNYLVHDNDIVFENDVLHYKAVLKKGAAPKEQNKEYSGTFDYTLTYPEGTRPEPNNPNNTTNKITTSKGTHTVSAAINQGAADAKGRASTEGRSAASSSTSHGTAGDNGTLTLTATPRTQDKSWLSQADTSWCDPDDIHGTYTLKTAAQLAGLAKLVNEGENFQGSTINLGANVCMKNADGTKSVRRWTGIGNSAAHSFAGTFDGKGYAISDMSAYSSGGTAGLFGYCKGATIRNVTVYGTAQSMGQTAGIAANCTGCQLINCVSYVKVTSSAAKAGGICAEIKNKTTLTKCRNKGAVTATYSVGGIVGVTDASGTRISQCANYGKVTGTDKGSGSATGGIAGYLGGLVTGSANFGAVNTANAFAGGIAGHTWANTKNQDSDSSHITASMNWGKVKCTNTAAGAAAGGLVGYGQYLLMSNCYNTGAVSLGYTGARAHKASLVGYFYKSTFNKIIKTYYSAGGPSVICKDVKDPANDGLDVSKQKVRLTYVKVTRKTLKKMKAPAFAKLMNKGCAGTFKAVKKNVPQLTWVTKLKECTVTYKGAYKGTAKTYYGGMVTLPTAPAGYVYAFKAGKKAWTGTNIKKNVTVTVTKSKVTTAYVIYQAGGKEVARTPFLSSDTHLTQAPPDAQTLAPRAGYTASWQSSDLADYWDPQRTLPLGCENIVVRAVYSQRQLDFQPVEEEDGRIVMRCNLTADMVAEAQDGQAATSGKATSDMAAEDSAQPAETEGGRSVTSGKVTSGMAAEDSVWFLRPEARGILTVEPGVTATVDGSNGAFTNLQIVVGEGANVTLQDMELVTDPAELTGPEVASGVLQLDGGSDRKHAARVCIGGNCWIEGTNDGVNIGQDGKRTECKFPALQVSGYGLIDQSQSPSDTLHISSFKDNPDVNILDDATLEIAGGLVEVYRYERLGAEGGMISGTEYSYESQSAKGERSGEPTVSGTGNSYETQSATGERAGDLTVDGMGNSYEIQSATGERAGNLTVSGGTLIAVSDTNNVFAFCVNEYKQTGGQVICYAAHAETVSSQIDKGGTGLDRAIYATKVDITGGSLRAKSRTHKDNDDDPVYEYENERAILVGGEQNWMAEHYELVKVPTAEWSRTPGASALGAGAQVASTQGTEAQGTSVQGTEAQGTSVQGTEAQVASVQGVSVQGAGASASQPVHRVTVDGKLYYEGPGPNVGYTFDTGDVFSTKRADIDQTLYLWLPRDGKPHQIAVDGKPVNR